MRKGTIKAAVLAAVFIGAVLIFGRFMNDTNEDLTTEMKEATLPVITMYQGDQELNELHGYVTEMDAAYMRDTITPVGEDRKLPIVIQTNQTAVDTISYEIRSLDATRLIANADVTSYEERSGKITADLQIQNLLEEGEEYLMIIRLGSGDRSICYYTRIAEPVDCYVSECVAFVKDFNDKTFNDETSGTLATYMERTTGDNTTLQYVSLNSSLRQVSWADFKGERLTEPVPSIKEITPTYNVIVLDYVVSSVNESGQIEYYNIEEYYRVRYTTSRIYLLNFERTMNQISAEKMTAFTISISSLESAKRTLNTRRMRREPVWRSCRRENSGATIRWKIRLQKCSVSAVTRELTAVRTTENTTSRSSVWTKSEAWIISCTVT